MTNAGPADASINGDGFRFYRWTDPATGESTDVLSVTSIRRLAGESFILVNWQLSNLIDVAMGTVKRTVIGPRGGVKEVHVKDEFPGEFARRLAATNGEQAKLDEVRKWLRSSADEPRNIAAARGTITHGAIEKNISDEAIDREYVEDAFGRLSKRDRDSMKAGVTDEDILFVQRCMTQYWDMRDKVPFVIIAREPQVWNLTAGYAGSADAIVWFLPEGVTPKDVPKANLITQEDIERIGGYTAVGDWKTSKGVYCQPPETLVLTDDLRWVELGSLAVGDGLLAFTEERVNAGKGGRRWARSEVTGTGRSRSETVRITLASGRTLDCTPDHPWLARRTSGGRRTVEGGTLWVQAQYLRPGDTLPRYLDIWDKDDEYEAGWFAGLLDGEGSLTRGSATHAKGLRLSFAQKEGLVLDRARRFMLSRGISWTESPRPGAVQVRINGRRGDILAILGSIRPVRLLYKVGGDADLMSMARDTVVSVEAIGTQEVVNLTTSTGTYIAEGYGSHNTDHVIQATAYTAAEFVGSGGVIDQRLTDILSKTRHGVLFHIRPDEWNTHAFEFTEPTLRAFLGCCAFARFLALHPKPDALFTVTHSSKDDE